MLPDPSNYFCVHLTQFSFVDARVYENKTADDAEKTQCVKNLPVWYHRWRTKQIMVPQSPEVRIVYVININKRKQLP